MRSEATLPTYLDQTSIVTKGFAIASGIAVLALLAQVSFRLPWTVVPITGQTFGVALIALTAGRRYALTIVAGYLLAGWVGAPVFAQAMSGLSFGPTLGYLVGMLVASVLVGTLADRGWTRSFPKALAAAYVGSAVIFTCGLFVLSFFVAKENLLAAGFYPFLIGDLFKNLTAAGLAAGLRRSVG